MIYVALLLCLACLGFAIYVNPIYASAWALVNTVTYFGAIKDPTISTLEELAAAIIGWFIAPFALIMS